MPLTNEHTLSVEARVFTLTKNDSLKAAVNYDDEAQEYNFWETVDRRVFDSSVSLIVPGYSTIQANDLRWFIHQGLIEQIKNRAKARRGRVYLSKLTLDALKDLRKRPGIKSSDVVKLFDHVLELRNKTIGACRPEDMFVTLNAAAYKGKVLRFLYPDEKTGVLYSRRVKVKRVNTDDFANVWFDAVSYVTNDSKSRLFRKAARFRRYKLLKASEMLLEETPVRKLQPTLMIVSSLKKDRLITSVQSYDALTSVATTN